MPERIFKDLQNQQKVCKINRHCWRRFQSQEKNAAIFGDTLFMRSKEFSRVRTLSGWSICWTGAGASPMTLLNVACGPLKRRRFFRRGLSPPRTVADSPSPSKLSGRDVANTTSKCGSWMLQTKTKSAFQYYFTCVVDDINSACKKQSFPLRNTYYCVTRPSGTLATSRERYGIIIR
jgi:hypothetical protein